VGYYMSRPIVLVMLALSIISITLPVIRAAMGKKKKQVNRASEPKRS